MIRQRILGFSRIHSHGGEEGGRREHHQRDEKRTICGWVSIHLGVGKKNKQTQPPRTWNTNLKYKFVEEETRRGEEDSENGYESQVSELWVAFLLPIRPQIPLGKPPRYMPQLLQVRHNLHKTRSLLQISYQRAASCCLRAVACSRIYQINCCTKKTSRSWVLLHLWIFVLPRRSFKRKTQEKGTNFNTITTIQQRKKQACLLACLLAYFGILQFWI